MICSIDECDLPHAARGLCDRHYQRARKRGELPEKVQRDAGAGELKNGYLRVTLADHDLADSRGRVYLHRAVLYDNIGPGKHPCAVCGRSVHWDRPFLAEDALTVDHIDHDPLNNDPSNLRPTCLDCNRKAVPDRTMGRLCSIEGCEKRHWSSGWCRMHWNRVQRHGDPLMRYGKRVA